MIAFWSQSAKIVWIEIAQARAQSELRRSQSAKIVWIEIAMSMTVSRSRIGSQSAKIVWIEICRRQYYVCNE